MSKLSGVAVLADLRPARSPAPARPPGPAATLRIADVAMFYGERSGGIRTYLDAKASFAARTDAFEHHLIVPGIGDGSDGHGRHEHRSLRLAASNGYRLPLGGSGLRETLRSLRPDVVMLHDPFWAPRLASQTSHDLGALVVAVHHSSPALHAAGLPGPDALYAGALRRWYRRAYLDVDAVMSVVDPTADTRRGRTLALRLGLDPAFRPRRDVRRGQHVLYAGRLSREKGVVELLDAAAMARRPWPLVLVGTGPAGDMLRDRAQRLGLAGRVRFEPYIADREQLALAYAQARCVVLPGAHETFGLAALEAAACGTAVVTARPTPSAALLGGFVETFAPGDRADLGRAIDRARMRSTDLATAAALGAAHAWDAQLTAELADLQELLLDRGRAA